MEKGKRITKDEAVKVLEELVDSGVLREDVENALDSIISCITDDIEYDLDTFGGDDKELFCLYESPMDPYHTTFIAMPGFDFWAAKKRYDDHFRKCEAIMKKYAKGREEE